MVESGLATGATARAARVEEWAACRSLAERAGLEVDLFDILTRVDEEHRPDYLRVIDLHGKIVSLTLVVPRQVIIAGVPVEGAVLTLVGTDPAYRGRGFMRLLLEDTVAFLRAKGFRIGMVYGPPELYRKFGFVPALGTYATTFCPANVMETASQPTKVDSGLWRPATAGDAGILAELFRAATRKTPCTIVRPAQGWVWKSRAQGSGISVYVVDGVVRAYVRWSGGLEGIPDGTLAISEVGADSPETLGKALEWAAGRASELGLTSVRFVGPPDHPFSRLAYLRAGAEVTVRPASVGQVIVSNRGLLMADIASALADRAISAGLPPGTSIVLDVGSKRFDLSFAGGRLGLLGGRAGRQTEGPVSRLPAEAFTLFVTGYAGGAEIDALPGVTLAPEHRAAMEALFPKAYPKWIPAPYW